MTSPDQPFSLQAIGHELDMARQARGTQLEAVAEDDSAGSMDPDPSKASTGAADRAAPALHAAETEERPLPLCLLCLTRPPSAVLLPCCHLNLCHMCAPLLILKSRTLETQAQAPALASPRPPANPDRVPFHIALMKATANHPKSRRLSIGHCEPVERGQPGGEVRGDDLVPSSPGLDGIVESPGLGTTQAADGRMSLVCTGEEGQSGARCLICRAGVTGWLRVYTG